MVATQVMFVPTKSDFAGEQLLTALVNMAYDALIVLDMDFRIVACNTAAKILFEHSNPVGNNVLALAQENELETLMESISMLGDGDESFEEQLEIRSRMHRVRIRRFTGEGGEFIALALQDVSERVRLNRARRDMVANISHELRTPIANIRLILDGLFEQAEKPKRKHSISALRAIGRETDSLLWIMQEMLDLSMIESGQALLRMVEYRLHQLVGEAIERIGDQSDAKGLTVQNDVASEIQVLCDPDQARRVLINLIHNAVKWSPAEETITIRALDGEDVTIQVLDNGPGVPDEQTERIFERFYQVDSSRSGHEGTGLGLAICRHIIAAHGGRVWAEGNGQGGGGRFLFTLPGVHEKMPEGTEARPTS